MLYKLNPNQRYETDFLQSRYNTSCGFMVLILRYKPKLLWRGKGSKNITHLVYPSQQRGALWGMPFLLCKSFLGFNAEHTQAVISSDDSANEIDDSISLMFVSELQLPFNEKSPYCGIVTAMNLWLWSSGFTETIDACKCVSMHTLYHENHVKRNIQHQNGAQKFGNSITLQAMEQ